MKKKDLCMLSPGTWVTHKKSGLEFEFVEVAKLIGSCDEAVEVAFCKTLPGRDYTSRNLHIVGDHYIFMPREITKKSIHDFAPEDVLINAHCTPKEAAYHLERGSTVFSPSDFWEAIRGNEELKRDLGIYSIDKIMERCKVGRDMNEFFYGMLERIPYIVQYAFMEDGQSAWNILKKKGVSHEIQS